MIPILMQDETTVGFLKEAISCAVTEERGGVVELTLTYHVTGALFDKLQIAQTYLGKGNRYTEIVKLNGLKSNMLKTGQVLQIPEK